MIQIPPAAQAPKKDTPERDTFLSNGSIKNGTKSKENGQQSMNAPTQGDMHPITMYQAPREWWEICILFVMKKHQQRRPVFY